jgi:signal transduction histidine kinase/putative methionine-R-sulfoxide reductase with GAF domain
VDFEQLHERVEFLGQRLALVEQRLKGIQGIAASLGASLQMEEILHTVGEQVTAMLEAERATVFLVDEDGGLVAKVIIGPELRELCLKPGQGIAGWVAATGKTLNVKDAYLDRRFDPKVDACSGFRTRTILCQPMKTYQGKVIGVIEVLNKKDGYFTMEDQDLLSTITTQASISIENSKYYAQLRESNLKLTEAQESLRRNYGRLETLYRIQNQMAQAFERGNLVEGVLGEILEQVPCAAVAVLLASPSPPRLYVREKGKAEAYMVFPALLAGVLADVLRTGAGVSIGRALEDGERGAESEQIHPQIRLFAANLVAEPLLRANKEAFGTIGLVNHSGLLSFSAEEAQLLKLVAGEIASAIERLEQYEELTKANNLALIGGALSGVLHDLKSPMSVISGFVQLMESEDDPDQRRKYSTSILSQFKLVSTMTQEVLAFARGERQILKRNLYMEKFLEEMTQLLNQEFAGRKIRLVVNNRCKEKFKADEGKLKRLVFNIARNARDAMPDGGAFTIDAESRGENIVFRFGDTGGGIPEEIRDRLFESFVTQGKKDGTGLGLAIVKNIVEQHGGTIEYETETGKGTTFIVAMPKG